jgi:lipopolysaccharide biosynthesis glycosyltransferase
MVDTVAVLQANYNICVDLATAFRDDKQFMDKIAMVHFSTVSSRNAFKRLRGIRKMYQCYCICPRGVCDNFGVQRCLIGSR